MGGLEIFIMSSDGIVKNTNLCCSYVVNVLFFWFRLFLIDKKPYVRFESFC